MLEEALGKLADTLNFIFDVKNKRVETLFFAIFGRLVFFSYMVYGKTYEIKRVPYLVCYAHRKLSYACEMFRFPQQPEALLLTDRTAEPVWQKFDTCLDLGLINQAVPAEDLDRVVDEFGRSGDARVLTEAIDKLLLHTQLDTQPLLEEAALIEEALKEIKMKTGESEELAKKRSIMYG